MIFTTQRKMLTAAGDFYPPTAGQMSFQKNIISRIGSVNINPMKSEVFVISEIKEKTLFPVFKTFSKNCRIKFNHKRIDFVFCKLAIEKNQTLLLHFPLNRKTLEI